jgi:hypothetical protein
MSEMFYVPGMTYEEKGAWVSLLAMIGTCGAYVAVVLGRAAGNSLAEVAYRSPMLWTMGISIALAIFGRIAVEMAKPSDTYKPDARDKEINRFSEYVGGSVLAIGMLVPFALVLLEAANFWIANAMFAAFALSAIVGTATKLVAYRRGF